jgi:CheY-like chemotaxis protein/class 3 adenylate cyclase
MKKILVVEDVELNRELVAQLLEDDYQVLTAADGAAGLRVAHRERPDLILMDLSLPIMDGWEAARRIKADPDLKRIPIIALSAHAMSGDAEKARQCGCDDYLSKPLDEKLLRDKLQHYLGPLYQRSGAAPAAGGHRILIVDDEPLNVDYLQQELEELGYDTMSARDGQEALECVAADPPDLILLDILMPVLDGFEVCRALKGNDATRLIPVVIMTTLDGIDDRIKGIEAGADDFLTKPVNQRQLIARLQTSLRLKHTVDRKLRELRQIKDHFAKFIPESVKRLVVENPEAPALDKRERDVSVLFVDISGYSRLTERVNAPTLNAVVERYFSTFLDRIHEGGGDINETAGDGFMAIFQDDDADTHAVKAVETALAVQADTESLNRESDDPPLAIHIGINSGPTLVGSTRFEGLRGARWTFTATGNVTNLAARLAAAAQSGQIIAGPETVRRLRNRYQLERLGIDRLKNIADNVTLHRVLGRKAVQ